MASLWPWLAVAGLGALHGLSPASGWMFAAASGVRTGDRMQAWRALLPIGIGHAASIAVVAYAFSLGMSMDRAQVQGVAGAGLVCLASHRWLRGAGQRVPISTRARHAGIALWSFLTATAHGAGLMLVPALIPLCLADGPAREITASGSLALAMAAVGVHMAATLATTGVIAAGVCHGLARHPRLPTGAAARRAWTVALAVTGGLLIASR